MANHKKTNPRTAFIIARATKEEKINLQKSAKASGYDFSRYVRKLLGFIEENE